MLVKAIVAALVIWLAYLARDQFPAFVVGMIVAYLLSRPVACLMHYGRFPRWLAILAMYVLVLGGAGLAVWNGWASLVDQATSLFHAREEIITSFIQQISAATGWNPNVAAVTTQVLDKAGTFVTSKPEELLAVGGLVSRSLLFLMVTLVSSIYFLKDADTIMSFCMRFVPASDRGACAEVVNEINKKFGRYIGGQFVLMGIMAVMVYTILTVYGLKYALIVALVAGVAEVIPIFGPVMAIILVIAIAASQLGLHAAMPVVGLILLARTCQDYLVIPKVIGHAMKLHPLVTLFFVMAGQSIYGGLGMLLGVPVAAAVNVLVDHFYPPDSAASGTAGSGKTGSRPAAQLKAIWADLRRLVGRLLAAIDTWRRWLGDQ